MTDMVMLMKSFQLFRNEGIISVKGNHDNPCFAIVDFVSKNVHFYDIINDVVKNEPCVISFKNL